MQHHILRVRAGAARADATAPSGEPVARLSITQVVDLQRELMVALRRGAKAVIHDVWWSRSDQSMTFLLSSDLSAADLDNQIEMDVPGLHTLVSAPGRPAGSVGDDMRVRAPWAYMVDVVGSGHPTTDLTTSVDGLSEASARRLLRVCRDAALLADDGTRRSAPLRPVWLVAHADTLAASIGGSEDGMSLRDIVAALGCISMADATVPRGQFGVAFSPMGYGSLDIVTCRWFRLGDGDDVEPEISAEDRRAAAAALSEFWANAEEGTDEQR